MGCTLLGLLSIAGLSGGDYTAFCGLICVMKYNKLKRNCNTCTTADWRSLSDNSIEFSEWCTYMRMCVHHQTLLNGDWLKGKLHMHNHSQIHVIYTHSHAHPPLPQTHIHSYMHTYTYTHTHTHAHTLCSVTMRTITETRRREGDTGRNTRSTWSSTRRN